MHIAIIGAAYTGLKAAGALKQQGHTITATTTRESRVDELKQWADHVVVMKGSDTDKMRDLIADKDVVLMTVAGGMVEKDGKPFMDPDLYRDAYVGTAESLAAALQSPNSVKQVIFTSSLNAYGDGGGAESITEETPSNPQGPFQSVYVETEDILNRLQSDDLNIAIYRTGTIYGPTREFASEAKNIAGQSIPFDGQSDIMIVHRDDVVRAMAFGIEQKLSGMYNVFNDSSESKQEFFTKICEREGLDPINWLGLSPGPRNVSNKKLKDLGFAYNDPHSERESEDLLP